MDRKEMNSGFICLSWVYHMGEICTYFVEKPNKLRPNCKFPFQKRKNRLGPLPEPGKYARMQKTLCHAKKGDA